MLLRFIAPGIESVDAGFRSCNSAPHGAAFFRAVLFGQGSVSISFSFPPFSSCRDFGSGGLGFFLPTVSYFTDYCVTDTVLKLDREYYITVRFMVILYFQRLYDDNYKVGKIDQSRGCTIFTIFFYCFKLSDSVLEWLCECIQLASKVHIVRGWRRHCRCLLYGCLHFYYLLCK